MFKYPEYISNAGNLSNPGRDVILSAAAFALKYFLTWSYGFAFLMVYRLWIRVRENWAAEPGV